MDLYNAVVLWFDPVQSAQEQSFKVDECQSAFDFRLSPDTVEYIN